MNCILCSLPWKFHSHEISATQSAYHTHTQCVLVCRSIEHFGAYPIKRIFMNKLTSFLDTHTQLPITVSLAAQISKLYDDFANDGSKHKIFMFESNSSEIFLRKLHVIVWCCLFFSLLSQKIDCWVKKKKYFVYTHKQIKRTIRPLY